MREILNKRQSTDGYKNGLFGNHLRQWDKPKDVPLDVPEVMIRWRGKGSGGPAVPTTRAKLIDDWIVVALQYGLQGNDDALYVSERCPDHKLTFQGEFMDAPEFGGYYGHFSREKTYQRAALKLPTAFHEVGHRAKLLCRSYMDHDSYDNLLTLLDTYPMHVVEFSCFSVRLGSLRRNTIFWEVRKF